MIFDVTDPIGAIQTVFSIIILVEIIQFFDKDDMGAHIQERVAFYSGIIGKVGDGLGKIGAGMLKIIGLFSKKEKDQEAEVREKPGEVYQMEDPEEEDPFEGEGGIEG